MSPLKGRPTKIREVRRHRQFSFDIPQDNPTILFAHEEKRDRGPPRIVPGQASDAPNDNTNKSTKEQIPHCVARP
jgi:hypothetical protein